MTTAKTNKVATGSRTKAEDDAALASLIETATAEGKKVVEEEGGTFIVEKGAFGVTLKTRIA